MTMKVLAHPSVADRRARGADARIQTPPQLHNGWQPAVDRPDPVDRPFEYDVQRMAASFTIAARNNGLTDAEGISATQASVRAYREAMAEFAHMGVMELWYTRMAATDIEAGLRKLAEDGKPTKARTSTKKAKSGKGPTAAKGVDSAAEASRLAKKSMTKALTRDSLQALSKLGELVDGHYRIISQPPMVVPLRDVEGQYDMSVADIEQAVHGQFRDYRSTLEDDRRHLLEKFEIIDMARKVVGVGSVGTRAFIILLQGRDDHDPLFLQVKEATRSVLEDHLPKSRYHNPGERVVRGQRLMQATSDIYLGWTKGAQANRFLYWRQLRDMKGSALVDSMGAFRLRYYAGMCGWTLARAHARAGDPVAIDAYLGTGETFDQAITDFSQRYADQNEKDYQAFVSAVHSGRIDAVQGV